MGATIIELPANRYFVKDKYRAGLVGNRPNLLEKPILWLIVMERLHNNCGEPLPRVLYDGLELLKMVVTKRHNTALQSSRHALRIKPCEQVLLEPIVAAEIRREIPIGPAVIPAERDDVATRVRARDTHRNSHRLSPATREARHMRPGVYLAQELSQLHLFWRIQRRHRAAVDSVFDCSIHIRVGVAEETTPHCHPAHIVIMIPVEVPDLASLRS